MSEPTTDAEKLNLASRDDLAEAKAELRKLFPAAITEGKIDFEKLRQLLGDDVTEDTPAERFGLSWTGKSDAIRAIQTTTTGTLLPAPKESVNFDTTKNLIIEGDNLEVLKLLQGGYHGRVKMIYIDPPFNTGNEFIYPDNYKEGLADYLKFSGQVSGEGIKLTTNTETDGRYHSKWLTMMYPRLFLARNLLREDGVIFVSIDDHEVHNLRAIMNEIFGEENFLAQLVVLTNPKGRVLDPHFSRSHEFTLVYAKAPLDEELSLPKSISEIEEDYDQQDGRGRFRLLELRNTHRQFGKFNRQNLWYPLFVDPKSGSVFLEQKKGFIEVLPNWDDGFEGCWSWGREKVREDSRLLVARQIDNKWKIFRKAYAFGDDGTVARKKLKTILTEKDFFTERGQSSFDELIPDRIFQSPKPVELIKTFADLSTRRDGIILDFFAGSGTTAQAVLELNAQDGGNRKFILIQLPEPTDRRDYPTITEITKERVRRVIKKLSAAEMQKRREEKAQLKLGDTPLSRELDLGFKVFRLSSSNFKVWDAAGASKDAAGLAEQLKLMAHNVIENRADDALLYELILKSNLQLTSKIQKEKIGNHTFYDVADGTLAICLERKLAQETLRGIITRKPRGVICLDIAFAGNDQLKTNIVLEMKSHGIEFHTA